MARRRRQTSLPVIILVLAISAATYWIQHRRDSKPASTDDAPTASNTSANRPAERDRSSKRTADDNLGLGMPSNASESTPDDYLISRPQYALSYNRSRAIPNWVAWHLDASDLGDTDRSQFAPDPSLPKGWTRITPNDYRNIGYDRGHMCPSGDRTSSKGANQVTFFMTNIVPQAADNNQGPWADLEDYCRLLARDGDELYIVAGVAGPYSDSSNGKVSVPSYTWKVITVLPEGDDDAGRVGAKTRVIAVLLPNENGIRDRDWKSFRVPASQIEKATGYTFLSKVDPSVRAQLTARADTQ